MKELIPTLNDIHAKTRVKSVVLLNQILADVSDLYSQAKQAHWNVRGPYFFTLHKLFDEVAGAVEGHIDTIAERVVQLGGEAKGTVRMAAKHSELEEFSVKDSDSNPLAYAKALAHQFAICAKSVRKGIDEASKEGDADTADLLTAVSRDIDKSLWFIEAHMRK